MMLSTATNSIAVACVILSSCISSSHARLAGAPENLVPSEASNTQDTNTRCADLSRQVVMQYTTCFDDASSNLLESKLRLVSPAAGEVDAASMKQQRKGAKKDFKKANKKCTKKLMKKLLRLQREEPCPSIEPVKVSQTILVCAMDEIPYLLCAEEVETMFAPPTESLADPPTIGGRVGGGVCCPAEEEPGVGMNPSCGNGQPAKCCPNGGRWGCGTDTEGEYQCGLEAIWIGAAEVNVRCNTRCDASIANLKIECPSGSGNYVSPDPSNGCRLDCPLPFP